MMNILLLDSIMHLLVDGVCVAALFGRFSPDTLAAFVMVYNTLAFSTQCLTGIITDRFGSPKVFTAFSAFAVALGFLLPVSDAVRVVLLGFGNSFFHVGGGTRTLLVSKGKAARLGVFVAPGALGVTLGTLFPTRIGFPFAVLLTACAAAALLLPDAERYPREPAHQSADSSFTVVLLLCLAVAVRAVGGSAVSFPWKNGALLSLLLTFFVWAGKTAGGFLMDRIGIRRSALLTVLPAALLTAFFSQWMIPSLLGQCFLNLTMPITLYLLYKELPDSPGFAFGLAASALWPGQLLGQMIRMTGIWRILLILVCFVFSLAAILHAERKECP